MDWRGLGHGELVLPNLRTLRLFKAEQFTSLRVLLPCTALETLSFAGDCKHQLTDRDETTALQSDPSFLPNLKCLTVRNKTRVIDRRPWSFPCFY